MEKQQQTAETKAPAKDSYCEPLLLKHEPLRNITGQKYGEKKGIEKSLLEV